MTLRRGLLLLCPLYLTGCVVADLDSTNYQYVPYVQTIQKKGTLGHTNTAQRKQNLYACGLDKKIDPDTQPFNRNQLVGGETMAQHDKRIAHLENCMMEKGYVLLDFGQCGPLKAPTGKCN